MMKKRIFSGVLASAITLSCFAATSVFAGTEKPEAKQAYSCDFTTDYNGFTDFFTTNVPAGMSVENGVLKLTGNTNVWDVTKTYNEVTVIEYDFMQESFTSRTNKSPIRVQINTGSDVGWRALLTYGNSNQGKLANDAYSTTLTPKTWYSVKYVIYPSGTNSSNIELFFGAQDSGLDYIGNYTMSNWANITRFQIFGLEDDLYLDNFSVASYSKEAYTEINKCETAEDVKSVLDFYISNKLMTKKSFDLLSDADKQAVCADIAAAAPYASANAFDTAFDGFIAAKSDGATIYYKWDFENGSLADYANGTEFMTGNSPSKDCVSVAADPNENAVNNTAKVDLSTSDEKLVSTSAVKNDLANVRYVVYDAKAYHNVYNASNEQVNLEFQVRYANATRKPLMLFQTGREKRWNTYKTVVDVKEQKEYGYIYLDDAWTISNSGLNGTDMTTFDPDQLRIRDQANNGEVYFDDVTIKGYKDLYAEVNTATAVNVCRVLEAFEAMQLIELDGYADLDDAEKAVLAEYVKATTYEDDAAVLAAVEKAISILSSEDDLVVISSDISDNKLTSATVAINADIENNTATLIVASYTSNDGLVAVELVPVADTARLAEVTIPELNLNIDGAAKVRYMLWDCGEEGDKVTPLVNVKTVALDTAE